MIRKLSSGKYRLYSRKRDPKTGRRRNLGTFNSRAATHIPANSRPPSTTAKRGARLSTARRAIVLRTASPSAGFVAACRKALRAKLYRGARRRAAASY